MKRVSVQGHIALIAAGLLFGINYWVAKDTLSFFNPVQIVAFRITGAVLVFLIADLFYPKQMKLCRKDMFIVFICGLLGITINQTMFFYGLRYSSPVETSILHTLSPLVVAVLSVTFLKESLSKRKIIGMLLGFSGCLAIVVHGKEFSLSDKHLLGNIFILINILSYSVFLVLIKPLMNKYQPIKVLKYLFISGLIGFLPLGLFHVSDMVQYPDKVSAWMSMFYIVIGTTIITYFLTIYSVKRLSASTVGFYIYLQPLIAALIGYTTGFENPDFLSLLSTVILFLGVWFVLTDKTYS